MALKYHIYSLSNFRKGLSNGGSDNIVPQTDGQIQKMHLFTRTLQRTTGNRIKQGLMAAKSRVRAALYCSKTRNVGKVR
jgi:hypothetical protein